MATPSISTRKSNNKSSHLVYWQEQMITLVTRFVIVEVYPLNFGESPNFVRLMTDSVNPSFRIVERQTLLQEAKEEFLGIKKELDATFDSLPHKISLLCRFSRKANRLSLIEVTANWIDSDWLNQSRAISFKIPHIRVYAAATCERIIESIEEWGIADKVLSVTFEDVTNDPEVTKGLKNVIHPILDGRVFCGRYVPRILNLCIQDGWELMSPIVTKIRWTFSIIKYRNADFGVFCKKYGLNPKKFTYDDEYDCDSFHGMMKICMPYKDALNEYITEHWAVAESNKRSDEESRNASLESNIISEQEWETASVFCRILGAFYEAIDYIASCYNPISSGTLLHLVNIAKRFSECRENVVFKQTLSVMEETFLKHFDKIPELYCVAAVMDPRIKLSGCECLMESFYQCTGNVKVNIDEQKREVSNLLHEMYNLYLSRSKSHFPSSDTAANSGTDSFAWALLSRKKQKTEDSTISELTSYLQTPQEPLQHGAKELKVLGWWKAQDYQVLASMARDLLATGE